MLGTSPLQSSVLDADSINVAAVVSAEWNQNLFNPPYVTVAGEGVAATIGSPTPQVYDSTTTIKSGFETKRASAPNGKAKITFPIEATTPSYAYKVVTYVRTNNAFPVMVNTYAKGGTGLNDAYGSKSVEATPFSWTKVETYIGSSSTFAHFDYTITAHNKDLSIETFDIYFTQPEVYGVSKFDYLNGSLWPSDSPFLYFRPGESYVGTGNSEVDIPENFRSVSTRNGQKMPCSPVAYLPRVATFKAPLNNFVKHGMLSDINPYQYYVSDVNAKSISAFWKPSIAANKIVMKFQTLIAVPDILVSVNNDAPINISIDEETGVSILYWNENGWSDTKWSDMPRFDDDAAIQKCTTINKIKIIQTGHNLREEFSNISGSADFTADASRLSLIEVSPRLEIDLSDFIQSIGINKSLDNGQTPVPISSIDSNDASIVLSSIPLTNIVDGSPLPIFSNENNSTSNVLANMLRKNVKFNISFKINEIAVNSEVEIANEHVQAGVFFADSWQEQDVDSVSVTLFDITRYLQTTPVPDYISKFRPVIEIVSDLFDFIGFTDYDYDSLYDVCNNVLSPVDIAYYYCNSKDKTIFDAIREIFLAYQIGAFVDEWGIVRFTTLTNILQNYENGLDIDDSHIVEGSFSMQTNYKPGKISVRYQSPKILQSASIQNIQDSSIMNSPSFILTTSNDIVWQQQSSDSVGFNYLLEGMSQDDSHFTLEVGDLLDIFHTYSVDFNGFAVVEDEIISFEFKEYVITGKDVNGRTLTRVAAVTSNIELQAVINDFIKTNKIFREDITVTPTGNIVNVRRGLFGTQIRDHDILSGTIASKKLIEGTISTTGVVDITNIGTNARVSSGDRFYNKNRIEFFEKVVIDPSLITAIGYVGGGFSSTNVDNSMIDKYSFPMDQRSVLSTGLSAGRFELTGLSYAAVAGYMVGGYSYGASNAVTTIDKYSFTSGSRVTLSTGLSSRRSVLAGVSHQSTAGYAIGGADYTSPTSGAIDKFSFPTDARSVSSNTLAQKAEWSGISNSDTAGYVGGGTNLDFEQVTTVYRIAFPTGTFTALQTGLGTATASHAGFSNFGLAGYFSGGWSQNAGTTATYKFLFSNDVRSTLSTGLSSPRYGPSGMQNSGVAGYVCGGTLSGLGAQTTVDKFSFPSDTRSIITTGLSAGRRQAGTASSAGAL